MIKLGNQSIDEKVGSFVSLVCVCVCAGDVSNSDRAFNHSNMAFHKDLYKAVTSNLSIWSSIRASSASSLTDVEHFKHHIRTNNSSSQAI